MMVAMTTYSPLAILFFTISWTAGMAAMMFPAIMPMALMYNRFVTNRENNAAYLQPNILVEHDMEDAGL
jgi:predicted metal-binding membrane protein